MDTDAQHGAPPSRLPTALAFAAAATVLALWGRGASAGAFLGAGMALAVLFAGSLTVAGMQRLGGLELPGSARSMVGTLLAASTLLLAVHFATLFARRARMAAALERGERVARRLEESCREGAAPRTLAEAGVGADVAEGLIYTPGEGCLFTLCFEAPGGRSCYDSEARQWQVRL